MVDDIDRIATTVECASTYQDESSSRDDLDVRDWKAKTIKRVSALETDDPETSGRVHPRKALSQFMIRLPIDSCS